LSATIQTAVDLTNASHQQTLIDAAVVTLKAVTPADHPPREPVPLT
jgi:hypothetical protein